MASGKFFNQGCKEDAESLCDSDSSDDGDGGRGHAIDEEQQETTTATTTGRHAHASSVIDIESAFAPGPCRCSCWSLTSSHNNDCPVQAVPCCPISSRCNLGEDNFSILEHLAKKHNVDQHRADNGVAEMIVPVKINGRPRQLCVALCFAGNSFLWSLKTAARADGETIAFACVQHIDIDHRSWVAAPPSPSSPAAAEGADAHAELRNFSPSTFRASIEIQPHEDFPLVAATQAAAAAGFEAPGYVTVAAHWNGHLLPYSVVSSDVLLSHGRGAIVSFPFHSHLFPPPDIKNQILIKAVLTLSHVRREPGE